MYRQCILSLESTFFIFFLNEVKCDSLVKPCSHVTSAFAFSSNVKNGFYGNKLWCLPLTFAFSIIGWQRSKKNANAYAYVTCEPTLGPIYTKRQCQRCNKSGMTLAILFSLKTIELLKNGVATYFQATPLISMRTELQASSQR